MAGMSGVDVIGALAALLLGVVGTGLALTTALWLLLTRAERELRR